MKIYRKDCFQEGGSLFLVAFFEPFANEKDFKLLQLRRLTVIAHIQWFTQIYKWVCILKYLPLC